MAVIKSSTVAVLLIVAILSSLSPCYEAGNCFGKPCKPQPPQKNPPQKKPPHKKPPQQKNCFSAYSVDHCDRVNCGYTCREHGFKDGGWCEDLRTTGGLCCCR